MIRALVYFALVFAAGFVLGTVRVLWLLPALGERAAELLELPLMLAVCYFAARFVVRRYPAQRRSHNLYSGLLALTLLLLMEFTLVLGLRGLSLEQYFAQRDPVSGIAYLLSLAAFSLFPWALAGQETTR